MRKAEDIILEYDMDGEYNWFTIDTICKAINEARKEAIEEIALTAKVTVDFNKKGVVMPEVDKQSILKLIDELK